MGLTKIDSNPWTQYNLLNDLMSIAIHGCIWTIITFTLELTPWEGLLRMRTAAGKIFSKKLGQIESGFETAEKIIDEDVITEE